MRAVAPIVAGLAAAVAVAGCASRAIQAGSSVSSPPSSPPSSPQSLPQSLPTSPAPVSSSGSGVIPWVDAPTPRPTPADPTLSVGPTDARACRADDLDARFDDTGGAMGTQYTAFLFRNVSDSTCVLIGNPTVTATGPGLPDVVARVNDFPGYGSANRAPGQDTRLSLMTTAMCAAGTGGGGSGGPTYHLFRVVLPDDGGTITVQDSPGLDLSCGLEAGQFYLPEQPSEPEPPLRVSMDAPSAVAAGSELTYVVALTNTSDDPVSLTPCPAYEQIVGTAPVDVERLNCDPVGAIAAHETVRFEMRFAVPAGEPEGETKLGWELIWPGGLSVAWGTSIDVHQ